MFTLRKVTGDGVELNFFLGKNYTLITQDRNPKEFEENRLLFGYQVEETYGFVYGEDGKMLALFPKQQNYIMVDGKTVDYLKHSQNEFPEPKKIKSHRKEYGGINYELCSQVSPNADEPFCLGIRPIGQTDEIPLAAYGKTFEIAFERLTVELNMSHFRIILTDKR